MFRFTLESQRVSSESPSACRQSDDRTLLYVFQARVHHEAENENHTINGLSEFSSRRGLPRADDWLSLNDRCMRLLSPWGPASNMTRY